MPSIPYSDLKQNNCIVEVIGNFVKLEKHGGEYLGLCPFHNEKTPSLNVNKTKQIFKCFGCGAGGDVFDFLVKHGQTHAEAAEYLTSGGNFGLGVVEKKDLPKRPPRVVWAQLIPNDHAPQPNFNHYKFGTPSKVWAYKTAQGAVIGFACRFDHADGSKDVLPLIFATDGKRYVWRFQAFDRPRPLFNLDRVARAAVVVLVEGEKCAEKLQALYPGDSHAFASWLGGTKAVAYTDFSPLAGKVVVFWPDNDMVGRKAMSDIFETVKDQIKAAKFVHVPSGLPKGWDGADVDFTAEELSLWLRQNMHDDIFKIEDETEEPKAIEPEPVEAAPNVPEPPKFTQKKQDPTDNPYFKVLGFETDDTGPVFVFFNKRLNCIQRVSSGGLSKTFFELLAPETLWRLIIGDDFKTPHQVQWVIETSGARGMFNDTNIRGRGAWFDEGRSVLHVGDRLLVDGEEIGLGDLVTKYTYPGGQEMEYEAVAPLPATKAVGLIKLLANISWEREVSATLLAGWCVLAPICGALDWRPHIWITGPAGTGKSWVFQNVVSRIVGNFAVRAQGDTTEAGIRQTLGSDARPVIFDEAEGEDRKSQDRIQSVLNLMRASSSADGGETIKGSAGGQSKTYKARACFAFASIGVPIAQQSDRTRITMLTLRRSEMKGDAWENFSALFLEIVDEEFILALRSRTIGMIPIIKKNCKVFAKAAATVLGSQRAGDQAGVLLAGAYSLESDGLISYDEALAKVNSHNWNEERGLDTTRDEMRLLALLMDYLVRTDSGDTRSIAELVAIATQRRKDFMSPEAAEQKLAQNGFRTDGEFLLVSNSNSQIKKILDNSPWSREHHRILARIEGATLADSIRFSGPATRAVAVPLKYIL